MAFNKWGKLDQMNRLRQSGALTDDEFEQQKAQLLRQRAATPPPPSPRGRERLIIGGIIAAAIVVLLATVGVLTRQPAEQGPSSGSVQVAGVDPYAAVATPATNSTGPAPPTPLTDDDLATAFALVYGQSPIEMNATGSRLELKPKRLLAIGDNQLALVSEGTRDGGMNGGACHGCAGDLRIDYLQRENGAITKSFSTNRFDEPGGSWGQPPEWHVAKVPGLPTLRVSSTMVTQGCVNTDVVTLKLTTAGVARTASKQSDDCSTAGEQGPWNAYAPATSSSDGTSAGAGPG